MPVDAGALTAAERDDLAAQLRPRPPIALGPVAAGAGATAMMDVSDGLLLDATRLADASRVSIDLDAGMDADDLRGGRGARCQIIARLKLIRFLQGDIIADDKLAGKVNV